jgi:hypothetical protein
VRADLALDAQPPATLSALVEAFAETSLLRRSMFVRIAETDGPVTSKGRVRAILAAYWGALDRELRLAQTLGLERRARPALTIEQWAARAQTDAQQPDAQQPEPAQAVPSVPTGAAAAAEAEGDPS